MFSEDVLIYIYIYIYIYISKFNFRLSDLGVI